MQETCVQSPVQKDPTSRGVAKPECPRAVLLNKRSPARRILSTAPRIQPEEQLRPSTAKNKFFFFFFNKDFSGSSVVKTPCFHCGRHRSGELRSHMPCGAVKKKEKRKKKETQMDLFTKQKQTCRHRKQTEGYQRGYKLGVWD